MNMVYDSHKLLCIQVDDTAKSKEHLTSRQGQRRHNVMMRKFVGGRRITGIRQSLNVSKRESKKHCCFLLGGDEIVLCFSPSCEKVRYSATSIKRPQRTKRAAVVANTIVGITILSHIINSQQVYREVSYPPTLLVGKGTFSTFQVSVTVGGEKRDTLLWSHYFRANARHNDPCV